MKCISPVGIKNPLNGKRPEEPKTLNVPCGKCPFCLSNQRQDWTFRLTEELRYAESAHFITLTYDEEHVPINHEVLEIPTTEPIGTTLLKSDTQAFLKRLRHHNMVTYQKLSKDSKMTRKRAMKEHTKIKYYLVGEYGENHDRPHYHAIMFNLQPNTEELIYKSWNKGFTHLGKVTPASIGYVTKYVINKNEQKSTNRIHPFASISNGIGIKYLEKNEQYHQENEEYSVRNTNGRRQRLPKYYKDKIFWPEQNKRMAKEQIQLMDESENREIERLEGLGLHPAKYQQEQTQTTINKILKNDKSKF